MSFPEKKIKLLKLWASKVDFVFENFEKFFFSFKWIKSSESV